jgi:hypothetical protein
MLWKSLSLGKLVFMIFLVPQFRGENLL